MVDVISQFLTSGSKLTDAIELFGTDFELANISIATILVTLLTAAVCGAVIDRRQQCDSSRRVPSERHYKAGNPCGVH